MEQQSNKFYTIQKIQKQSGSIGDGGNIQFILPRGKYSTDSFVVCRSNITGNQVGVDGMTYNFYTPNITLFVEQVQISVDGELVYNTNQKHFISQQQYIDNFNRDKFTSLDKDNKQSKYLFTLPSNLTVITSTNKKFDITMNIKDFLPFLFKPNQTEVEISQQMTIQIRLSDSVINKICYMVSNDKGVLSQVSSTLTDIYFYMKKYNNDPIITKMIPQSCYFQYQYVTNSFTFSQNLKDKVSKFQLLGLTNVDIDVTNFFKSNDGDGFIQSCNFQGIQTINCSDVIDSQEIMNFNISTQRYSSNMYTLFNQELENEQVQVDVQSVGSNIKLIFGIQYYIQRKVEGL